LANSVDIKMEADVAAAVRNLSKVVAKQNEITKNLGVQARKSKSAQTAGVDMGNAISKSMRNIVTAAGGVFAIGTIFSGIKESLSETRQETIKFEDELTALLSLGENARNISAIKNEVVALSTAWGLARSEVINSMFDIQSGASSLGKEMRDSIRKEAFELVKATGVDLPTATKVLIKSWNIYGKELKDVNETQNKLFKAAEIGFLTFNDLAVLLPDVASAAKTFGYSFDEVLGGLATATQKGGKTEKTFTGIRNVFLRMDKALQMGVVTQGSFLDQIEQLSKVDPRTLTKIFGAEAIAAISTLVESSGALKDNTQAIATSFGDLTKNVTTQRLQDMSYFFSEINKSLGQVQKNQLISPEYVKRFGQIDISQQLAEIGYKDVTPSFLNFLAPVVGGIRAFEQWTGWGGMTTDVYAKRGQQMMIKQLIAAGRSEEADIFNQFVMGGEEGGKATAAFYAQRQRSQGNESAAQKLEQIAGLASGAANDIRRGDQPESRNRRRQ